MNALLTLWLFVFISMAGLTVVFWLVEHYGEYLSNFYVLVGFIFGVLIVFRLAMWIWNRLHRPSV